MSRDERALVTGLSDPAVPPAMATGDLEILGLLPRSSNYTFLARAGGGDDAVLVVYKPRRGEIPLWDFPEGTLCQREVAAYLVARALGWPNVPATILRGGPEGVGSVQRFVPFDPEAHYFTLEPDRADDFRRVALFDVVVNNADRKGGHCLLGEDGTIWVIDHGVCFSEEPHKLRTVIWEHVDEPIEPALLEDLRRFAGELDGGDAGAVLADLLTPQELAAMRDRVGAVLAHGRFPEPGPGRPYPWPPV
ncbi:MAG: SCO1664 family protein [Actinomycetota bacterium]